ncbi:100K [Equine adenovirus 2]|uniref:100K n=1 Tax=Equine adenovirus B serotype 2 TaxID=67603 RepID=A0A0K1DBV8_ADEE2|nr:100K [Equine adenovirus 2]AKT26036.1 100K [Equine adenovirus 2]
MTPGDYISEDVLQLHCSRQAKILRESLEERWKLTPSVKELSEAIESFLFRSSHHVNPIQKNGTAPNNPQLNFYPTFMVPETLATYHLFFQNQPIPLSCKANRTSANEILHLKHGSRIPEFPTLEDTSKIFEGLGDEVPAANALKDRDNSKLVELRDDSPRLAVVKRNTCLSHFAYPAVNLPPKVMTTVIHHLLVKKAVQNESQEVNDGAEQAVSDEQLKKWLETEKEEDLSQQRKNISAAVLVGSLLHSIKRFFHHTTVLKKTGESLHYMFKHGYVRQAVKISNVDITHLVSYMGLLHENRLGQSVLHNTLKGDSRLDYVRDTIYLFLIYTWQTAMGIWQQCLQDDNLRELEKILERRKKDIWCSFDEEDASRKLSEILFPQKLLTTLQNGLPDLASQSMMQNFRSFILERSGILPCLVSALPTDFVPIHFKESPPTLWAYTYFLRLANYLMYHNNLQEDSSGDGLLECYCRCNLCTPHRSLATNPALLNEVQVIDTFELQAPTGIDGKPGHSLKLTAGAWTTAYLKKFEESDYHPYSIRYFDSSEKGSLVQPTACVINQAHILAQLQSIRKAREEFLLKKGRGVYLDPQTGEELGPVQVDDDYEEQNESRQVSGENIRGGRKRQIAHPHRRGQRGSIGSGGHGGTGHGARCAGDKRKPENPSH